MTGEPRRLVVVAGGFQGGKMPLARALMAADPRLVLVHRDTLRDSFVAPVDEWIITLIMVDIARRLLGQGLSVVSCAWNLERADRALWEGLAAECGVPLEWLDVREPQVKWMIPPRADAVAGLAS